MKFELLEKHKLLGFIFKWLQSIKWFEDTVFQRLVHNTSWLFIGNIVTMCFGLFCTIIRTRALGPEKFGLLVVIIAYVEIIGQFATFQSWQALIKYGTDSLQRKRPQEFIGFVKLSFFMDCFSAIVGTLIAVSGAYFLTRWLGWTREISAMAGIYSLSLLFDFSGVSTGILQTLDRFKTITIQKVISSSIRLIGMLVVFIIGGDIWAFLLVTLISNLIDKLLLFAFAIYALLREHLIQYWRSPILRHQSFVRFSLWIYLSTTLDLPVQQFDVMIVSAVVSLEAAGIYKVIKQISQLLGIFSDPVYQSVYPQFATMIASKEREKAFEYAFKIGSLMFIVLGVPAVLLASTSYFWLGAIFGQGFEAGWIPLSVFVILKVISMSVVVIHPLFNALGYVKQNSIILVLVNALYIVLAIQLGFRFGLLGLVLAFGYQFFSVALLKIMYIKHQNVKQLVLVD